MIKFYDKKKAKERVAYRAFQRGDSKLVHVQFTKDGKAFSFHIKNIDILSGEIETDAEDREGKVIQTTKQENTCSTEILVYELERECYKCKNKISVITYLLFDDKAGGSLTFPWDKKRLNKNKTVALESLHMMDSSIEYYPILTIGADYKLDKLIMGKYPERIRMEYSNTQRRKYPMNVCSCCGAKQGEVPIYQELNKKIKDMEELKVIAELQG